MLDRISGELSLSEGQVADPSRRLWPHLWWLNLLLFAATLLTTTVFGFALQRSFDHGRLLDESAWLLGFHFLFQGSSLFWSGVWYSIPLLLILSAHELGHYAMCKRWEIAATLPFFGPSPSLLGTVGAFIWIRSPIYRRKALFDVGISGPLLGFLVLVPFLVIGIWKSKVVPGFQLHGDFTFDTPLLFRLLEGIRFPGVAPANICLHPMAMAAWAGLLATAINLLPVGQLDGGHIVYAVLGERGHRTISFIVIGALAIGGLLYRPWWIWTVAMFFFRRHPLIHDSEPLGRARQLVSLSGIVLLLLCFSIVPVRTS